MSGKIPQDFNQLIDRHSRRMFSLLYRLTGDYHAAQDLAQDVFLIACREYPKFQGRSEVYTWLYRIAVNRFKRYHRFNRMRSWIGLADLPEGVLAVEVPDTVGKDQRSRAVAGAVASLPPDFRNAITLFYFDELDCRAISEILECSEGTVKSRLWRGRQMLAKKLKGLVEETGVSS